MEIELETQKDKFTTTIKGIRRRNFSNNLPFLILSENLPEGQSFREFPDGHIEVQEVYTIAAEIKTKHIRTLTSQEADQVRQENGLF
jgi:hypothetical protein